MRWIRQDVLAGILDLKHARMAQLRKRLAGRFEHKESDRPGSPVWLFAPFWLRAWAVIESQSTTAAVSSEQSATQKREHFQALTEEAKYLQLIGGLVPVEHIERVFSVGSTEFNKAIAVAEQEHPPAAERFIVALDSFAEMIATEFNVHVNNDAANCAAGKKLRRAKQAAPRKVAKAVR